jgi:hypothetical protein
VFHDGDSQWHQADLDHCAGPCCVAVGVWGGYVFGLGYDGALVCVNRCFLWFVLCFGVFVSRWGFNVA